MTTVGFSSAARQDLISIGDYIARDDTARALLFVGDIETRCHDIGSAPEAAPLREDIAPGLRMAVHGNYLIFYRLDNRNVRIERILHGARNLRNLLR